MIAYDLQCHSGHSFEGWFEDGKAYDDQKKRGLVTCPVCNATSVSRIPSTFAIKASQNPASFPPKQAELEKIGTKIVDLYKRILMMLAAILQRRRLKYTMGPLSQEISEV